MHRLLVALAIISVAIPPTILAEFHPTSSEDGTMISVSAPRAGASYTYHSPMLGVLEVTVGQVTERVDGLGRNHTVVDLDLSWIDDDTNFTYDITSSVEPVEGLIVNEFARCGAPTGREGPTGKCGDERGLLLFASGGLPGGFLAAPFWGDNLTTGQVEIPLRAFTATRSNLTYDVTPADGHSSACVNLTASRAPSPHLRPIERFTPIAGPGTLCDGLALPYAFKTAQGPTWTLKTRTPGGETLEIGDGPSTWEDPGDPLPMADWQAPFVVSTPTVDEPISVPQAHEIALEKSESYRNLFKNGTDPLVVSSLYHRSREGSRVTAPGLGPDIYRDSHRVRSLTGMATDGTYVRLEVVEHVVTTFGIGAPEDAYGTPVHPERFTLRSVSQSQASEPVNRSTLAPAQATFAEAIERGKTWTQKPIEEEAPHGKMAVLPGHLWDSFTRSIRPGGYTIFSTHEDPTPYSPFVVVPYTAVFDGPTGATLWVSANNSTLRP